MKKSILLLMAILALPFASGCSRSAVGGAAVGAGATGAAYEYQNKQALDELDEDFRAGRISEDEYFRRKKAIEDKSLVY